MVEEKEEEIAFEIFGKRLQELKDMTENIGKTEKQTLKEETNKEIETLKNLGALGKKESREEKKKQFVHPKKIREEIPVSNPLKTPLKSTSVIDKFKEKFRSFQMPKLKQPEINGIKEKSKKELQNKEKLEPTNESKKNKISKIEHPIIKGFFGMDMGNTPGSRSKLAFGKEMSAKPKRSEKENAKIKEQIAVQRIPSAEKQDIFANLKQLNEKIDKNKEEIYNQLIRESAESKRMIKQEREQTKQQMIELLAESIGKLDSKDKEIKGELYEELQKIKNKFYGEKKEIRNLFMKGSKESRKMLESEREKMRGEFFAKITNLRNRINEEEEKAKKIQYEKIERENNLESGDKKHFSLFNRFKRLPKEKEIETDFKTEQGRYSEENFEDGDIITGMPTIPNPVDLGLPKFSPTERFMNEPKNESPEIRPFSRIEEEAIDNEDYEFIQSDTSKKFTKKIETPGDYEKSIKDLIAPQKVSKLDSEFEGNIRKAIKKGMKNAERKNKLEKKDMDSEIINVPRKTSKKSVYVEERDFRNVKEEIEQTKKSVCNFERVVEKITENSKKEYEKISGILKEAEDIKTNFVKINSGVLGKVR